MPQIKENVYGYRLEIMHAVSEEDVVFSLKELGMNINGYKFLACMYVKSKYW